MNVLAIDVGSSSVKMGLLRGGKVVSSARQSFPTQYDESRAEVDADSLLRAIRKAAAELGEARKRIDCVALATMSPSWVAIDAKGRALTPVITHQDRRSVRIAEQIEHRVGRQRHLDLAGMRPIPGGLSSTTCAWFLKHERSLMKRADLVGHVQTLLLRQFCGSRVVDPSHASFMGLFSTLTLDGWNDELCDAIDVPRRLLPEIRQADEIGGTLSADAARSLGVAQGTPVLVGMIDTGAAVLLAGAKVGQLVNVVGTTDVLALCTDRPRPHERLLLRALGVGRRWLAVGTLGSAGSSIEWARRELFADLSDNAFYALVDRLSKVSSNSVRFEPYLAGDRCTVEQRRASFHDLTLSTTRHDLLAAMLHALARASAERIELLRSGGTSIRRRVLISGGGGGALARLMHRDWPGRWSFWTEDEATMRGLAVLAERARTSKQA